jgi:predicted nucleotidyltransferase
MNDRSPFLVVAIDTAIESRALAAVKVLSGLGVVRAAYLFGSHVEGTPDQWSDIDVAVFMEGVEQWDIHQRTAAMALVMEEVGSEVEAHLFPALALCNPPRGGFAEYILRHGIHIFKQQ